MNHQQHLEIKPIMNTSYSNPHFTIPNERPTIIKPERLKEKKPVRIQYIVRDLPLY